MERTVQVKGMNCGHCKQTVEKAIANVGAIGMVDLSNGFVNVQFDENKMSIRTIIEAIEEQGYDVQAE